MLDAATHARITLSDPPTVVEADKVDGQFALSLDVETTNANSILSFEAFDASGATVAVAQSPPFPVAGITARVRLFVAAPNSLAAAPVQLPTPRSGIGASLLSYGVILAGGRGADGADAMPCAPRDGE